METQSKGFDFLPPIVAVSAVEQEAAEAASRQKKRLTNDSLNTLSDDHSFKQFTIFWLILLTALGAVLVGFVFPMHHDVEHLLSLHDD